MAQSYKSRRAARKLARNSQRNFIITLVLIVLLLYVTLTWILPFLINSVSFVKNIVTPSAKVVTTPQTNATLAPPVLNIPYEATNSGRIDIPGYATPKAKIKLYIDDEDKQKVDADENGNFIFQNINLSLGTNNIYAKTIDENNTESLPSKLIKVIFDNQKPTLTLNSPEDNKIIQGGDKKVNFSGKTDPGNAVFINNSQVIVDKDGNFNSEQLLNEGDNNFNIKALSKASNTTEIARKVTYNP
ncbi:hypothetical protein HYW43_02460 [Candidatus Daviesbacteria bacterium]|nr:hypothetical protein [Candidatus Daviesbacteria bacterium]